MVPIILPPPEDRFWLRFDKKLWRGTETDCTIWTGARNRLGYGVVWLNGKLELAHRVAFLRGGGIFTPERRFALHRCDKTACVTFECLFAGSGAENSADMAKKGRGTKSKRGLPYGVKAHGARFVAQVGIRSTMRHCGVFLTVEEAAEAARVAKDALRGA